MISWSAHLAGFGILTIFLNADLGSSDNLFRHPYKLLEFDQKLNHSDPKDNRTFKQRFLEYSFCDDHKVPITFVYVGGLQELSYESLNVADVWYLVCQKFRTKIFFLEHRYLGKSKPFQTDLKYLDTDSSISDVVNFIRYIKDEYNLDPSEKFFLLGCSYGGTIAAWTRYQHPLMVDGAIIWSSPIIPQLSVPEYSVVALETLKKTFPICYDIFSRLIKQIVLKYEENEKDPHILKPFIYTTEWAKGTVKNPKRQFVMDMWNVVNLHYESLYKNSPFIFCSQFVRNLDKYEEFEAFGRTLLSFNTTGSASRLDYSNPLNPRAKSKDASLHLYQWLQCNGLGWFIKDTRLTGDFFQGELDGVREAQATCRSTFGINEEHLREKVELLASKYRSIDANLSNVIEIIGELDSWRSLSLLRLKGWFTSDNRIFTRKNNQSVIAVLVPGGLHCSQLSDQQCNGTACVAKNNAIANIVDKIFNWTV